LTRASAVSMEIIIHEGKGAEKILLLEIKIEKPAACATGFEQSIYLN